MVKKQKPHGVNDPWSPNPTVHDRYRGIPQVPAGLQAADDPAFREKELPPAAFEANIEICFMTSELPQDGQITSSTAFALRTSSSKGWLHFEQTNSKSGIFYSYSRMSLAPNKGAIDFDSYVRCIRSRKVTHFLQRNLFPSPILEKPILEQRSNDPPVN